MTAPAAQQRPSHTNTLVIFDMDGTLTRPQLDFDLIRRDIGLEIGPQHPPILESLSRMAPPERARAEAILHHHETLAAQTSELQEGAAEVIASLRRHQIPMALMTRNSRPSVATFLARHQLKFDRVRTREDGINKPSPVPVFELCRALDKSPGDTWVVGDFHFDILCGRDAGAKTVLLWEAAAVVPPIPPPDWAAEADHVIHRLPELLRCMGLAD